MKSVIIFDFDGTIADTFPVVVDIFHKVERRTVPLNAEEELLMRGAALMQIKLRAVMKAAAKLNISIWRVPFVFAIVQLIQKRRLKDVQPFPGMPELIKKLHAEGHQMYIISTNTTGNIRRFLRAQGLDGYFVKAYGGARSKNKAGYIHRLLRRKHVSPQNVFYVGDEDRDMFAAHGADVRAVAVTWGYNDPEQLQKANPLYTAATPTELAKVLR